MDDIERLRRWIEDPPELAIELLDLIDDLWNRATNRAPLRPDLHPDQVTSAARNYVTSLTDELQRLREEKDDAEAVWTVYGKAQRERAEKAEAENTELRAALEELQQRTHERDRHRTHRPSGAMERFEDCRMSNCVRASQALASHTGDTP